MSYAAAQHLASYGRGGDTELVHMSKGEVKGLQDLALAHGGSLTVNPTTGLPEAGFLTKILPMVAGAALAATGVGAPMAALMVGGGYGLATGSINKGLMAGLGAWGGAGLASSVGALGAEAAASAGQQAATQGFKTVGEEALKSGLADVTSEAAKTAAAEGFNLPANYADLYAKTGGEQQIMQQAARGYLTPQNFPGLAPQTLQQYQAAVSAPGAVPTDVISAAGRAQGAVGVTTPGSMATGLKQIATSPTAAGTFVKDNALTLAGATLPFLMQDQQGAKAPGYQEDEYDRYLKSFRMSPDYRAYEAPRPNPYYQAQYQSYAAGGITNPSYPQAGIDRTQYAVPSQMPTSAEVVNADYDAKTNPYTGMAAGGIARYASKGQVNVLQDYLDRQERQQQSFLPRTAGIPDVGIYRDTDVDTARKDALTASLIRLGKAGKAAGIKTAALPKTSLKGLGDISGATQDTTEAAKGGVMSHLGGYSDGGRMLKGPGDGMSDSIPATISGKQPARLADGEFVVPADVVSHLGNGSTDAGAKKLYGMMDRIRKARTGKKKQAPAVKANRYMPA